MTLFICQSRQIKKVCLCLCGSVANYSLDPCDWEPACGTASNEVSKEPSSPTQLEKNLKFKLDLDKCGLVI